MSKIVGKAKIIGKLTTKEEIVSFMKNPSWSIREFEQDTEDAADLQIDLPKLNKLTGLQMDAQEVRKVLPKQINFINHLQKISIPDSVEVRVRGGEKLTYKKLMEQIANLQPSASKGETGDWDPMALPRIKSDNYYVVKDSLYKE